MKVTIIIVNYRTASLVRNCLQSLESEVKDKLCNVIVVDNNSCDNSVELLQKLTLDRGWESWVDILPLKTNAGFAFGNNKALETCLGQKIQPDLFWLLNPDTVVRKNSLNALVDFAFDHPSVGIAGSRIENINSIVQISAFRDHSVISEFLSGARLGFISKIFSNKIVAKTPISHVACKADWVSGASMMIRRQVFEEVGLFDETYFLYYEEVDLCVRSRQHNWECWYVPESVIVHIEGAVTGIVPGREKATRRPSYWFKSRRHFFQKHHGRLYLLLADFLRIIGYSSLLVRNVFQRKKYNDPPHFLRDFILQSSFLNKD